MNGAESLMRALAGAGVEYCFTNPGTTEIHLVAALEQVPGIRSVLGLFEGVCSGAADGYARMAGKPAATLLHLGPGLANALANFHNARRAGSPVVNLVGDHPAFHRLNDPPLHSDIATLAAPVSVWVRDASGSSGLGADGYAAVWAASRSPGGIATLIVPADRAWKESAMPGSPPELPAPSPVSPETVGEVARMLTDGKPTALLLSGRALHGPGLELAARIAARTGATLISHTFEARFERGAGLPLVKRLPYFPEAARKRLEGYAQVIPVGTTVPTSFFAYPDSPVQLLPDGCAVKVLAGPDEDIVGALDSLADSLDIGGIDYHAVPLNRPGTPAGALTAETAGAALGALLPENAVVSDESGTSGAFSYRFTAGAPPHDWLCLTGGSIGQGIPVATGAALACPGRKVVCLQGDGGAMYTVQGLWTQARENLDVTTVIFSNRSYGILRVELERLGFDSPGAGITDTMDLSRPDIDWVKLSSALGVPAVRADSAEGFYDALAAAFAEPGPRLIEAVI